MQMDNSTFLAIVGTLATVILGSWSIYLALKRRYPGHITFLKESSIGLFDSVVTSLPELSILYNNTPISQNLVLLKGILHNTGSIDITEDMVKEKLSIVLPEGFKWLAGKVVSSSPKIQASIRIDAPTILTFDLGLFRCDEYIRFEALAEVPLPRNSSNKTGGGATEILTKSVSFQHRIANTRKITVEDLVSQSVYAAPFILRSLASLSLLMALSIYTAYTVLDRNLDQGYYLMRTNDGKDFEVIADYSAPNEYIDIRGVANNYYERIIWSEFERRRVAHELIRGRKTSLRRFLPLSSLLIPIVLFFLSFYVEKRRRKKISSMLEA
jgi:hypothetical protein